MTKTQHSEITDNINKTQLVIFCNLLTISKPIDCFSQLLTVLVLGIAIISSWWANILLLTIFCTLIFIIGLIEKYYALRLYLDKKLFDYLANHLEQLPTVLLELDETLVNLNLIKANSREQRTLVDRQHGTMQLFKRQLIMLIIQLLLLIVTFLTGIFLH